MYSNNNNGYKGYNKGTQGRRLHQQQYNQQQQYQHYDPQSEYSIIQSVKYIQDKYPHLVNININNLGFTDKVRNEKAPRFYVIKSFTEEDIHKSIKYSCWSSTTKGNRKLNVALDEAKQNQSNVYLFFSMNGSGRFVGVARMASECNEKTIFEYWAMDEVWKGLFEVEWIFIKDIPNKFLKNIVLR
jgi:signal recognition particle GTPase